MHNFRPFTSKRCSLPHRPPLPIFKDSSSKSCDLSENISRYNGKLNGYSVSVEDDEAMMDLYTMGYFGSGSLSSGYPSFCKKRKTLETAEIGEELSLEKETLQSDPSCFVAKETLNLTLEEAFFLSHALNILLVYHNDEILTSDIMWMMFQNITPNFIPMYVAYHHFRSKGWVVKPGIKFGGDYTLYKEGPPFYHASFVVQIVYNLNETERHQGFIPFLAHYRALEVVKKDLIICQIIAPQNLDGVSLTDLKDFKISEYLFKRWASSENRE